MVLITPALALTIYRAIKIPAERQGVSAIVVIYLLLVTLTFNRKMESDLRGWHVLALIYLLGVIALLRGGLVGDGRIYLTVLPILGIMLVNVRAGIIVTVVSIGTYAIFTLLAHFGHLENFLIIKENTVSSDYWIYEGLVLAALIVSVMVVLIDFYEFLMATLESEIKHAQDLRALNRINIEQGEVNRAGIAKNLHDITITNLTELKQIYQNHPDLLNGLDEVIDSLRDTIYRLRPEMLSYGLKVALEELTDMFNARGTATQVYTEAEGPLHVFDAEVELNLFRIVEQAGENALNHAQSSQLQINAQITESEAHITITDDGVGFAYTLGQDLGQLIAQKHFGLVNMFERAGFINADLTIKSQPGQGTKITLHWQASPPSEGMNIQLLKN